MKTIDLTGILEDGKVYYPGDPELSIKQISTVENDGWNLRQIKMSSHDGTHVNVPVHGKIGGKILDDYKIEDFIGESVLYEKIDDIKNNIGIIFHDIDINFEIAKKIIELKPKFVGLSDNFEFNIDVEKYLLENDMILFERLANTDKLSKSFMFYGVPLNIKDGDGSPVRAYVIV